MTHLLDLQLEAGLRGDFERGWEIAQLLPQDDPRAQFNRGWYKLQQGELQEGHRLLDSGRFLNVFGNRHIGSKTPIWDGKTPGIVLLNLEGGLGDQIHGARWAKDIAARDCLVVLSCSEELIPILKDVDGAMTIVSHEKALNIPHTAWLPSMSAVVALGYEYEDLKGKSYIDRTAKNEGKTGVRWSGNPKFEHEQHRLFPRELMFDAMRNQDCISLQKGDGEEHRPDWMAEVPLNDWEDTRKAISMCSRVITSCTSIAHLSAAMGVETWIVVPILPYYLWAAPGEKTRYYDSVRLFRQVEYGDWAQPFREIKNLL